MNRATRVLLSQNEELSAANPCGSEENRAANQVIPPGGNKSGDNPGVGLPSM